MIKEEIQKKIEELEALMQRPDFWQDKSKARSTIKELQQLKDEMEGGGEYDKGDAVMTIFSGAGGDDAEDFSAMLFGMYRKFFERKGFLYSILHENQNDHGGFRNITLEISGNPSTRSARSHSSPSDTRPSKSRTGFLGPYGILRNESGVHRLVRVSPFNANQKRHTSFSMVEVIPKFEKTNEMEIPEDEIKIEFAKSSGPGGQNVNKRETAVRLIHIPTGMAAHVESERSQAQNKEKALTILKGKLYKMREEERIAKEKGMYVSKTTQIEWGNQIRSYVLHPYKMVKDHRTLVETSDVESVLEQGNLDEFIEAEQNL